MRKFDGEFPGKLTGKRQKANGNGEKKKLKSIDIRNEVYVTIFFDGIRKKLTTGKYLVRNDLRAEMCGKKWEKRK